MGYSNPHYHYKLKDVRMEHSPAEKDPVVLVDGKLDGKLDMSPGMCIRSPGSQPYSGLHQNKCGQQGEGGDPPPLLCPDQASAGVLHPGLGSLVQNRRGSPGECPAEGHEDDRGPGASPRCGKFA